MEVAGSLMGRAAAELSFAYVRDLEEGDLIVRQALAIGSKPPAVKQLRATHHKLAQNLAHGFSDAECSISTGYSPSRISILKSDPAFKELLAFYTSQRTEVFLDVTQRMAGAATTAVEVLQERLEDSPESFSNKDLLSAIKTTADRGGYSPIQKTETKTIVLDARALASMKEEVEAKQNGQVRRINQADEAARVKTYLSAAPSGNPILINGESLRGSEAILEATEGKGSTGEGTNL